MSSAGNITPGSSQTPQVLAPANADVEAADAAPERGKWVNPLDFVMSMVAFAVGLGNVWRFPYLAFKWGGGSFLSVYAIFFITVAVPMMMLEAAMGQYMGLGATEIWKVFPLLKGVGIASVILCFMVVAYYHVIIVWAMFYIISSLIGVASDFPWEKCDQWWNADEYSDKVCVESMNPANLNVSVDQSQSAASQFFENRVLMNSHTFEKLGGVRWELVLLMALLWVIIYFCIWRSLIKARYFVWFSAVFPYIILFALLIRGAMLDGAGMGIIAYLKPKPSAFLEPQLWKDAGSQIFFSYGIGNGGIISLGAYNDFNHNVIRDAIITCFVNGGTSIIAGFAVFSTIGNLAFRLNTDMETINSRTQITGTGLGFKIYPEAVAHIPPKWLWAIGFFFMLFLLGLNSQVCLAEGAYSSMEDRFPKLLRVHKKKCLALYCLFTVCISQIMITQAGNLWLDLFDSYGAAGHSLLFVAFFEIVGISWGFGAKKVLHGIYEMRGSRPCRGWIILWKYLGPLAIGVTFILSLSFYRGMTPYMGLNAGIYKGYSAPFWVEIIGYCFSLVSMLFVPGYAVYFMLSKDSGVSFKERFREGVTTPPDVNKERVQKYSKVNAVNVEDMSVSTPRELGSSAANA